MSQLRVVLLVTLALSGCGEQRDTATSTVAPADPRPATTITATMDERTMIATSGSPRPETAVAPGTQFVTIGSSGISMRALIPRGHTIFQIQNETESRHDLVLQENGKGSVSAGVEPVGRATLQTILNAAAYRMVCTTPGHDETAQFTTYQAGSDLAPRTAPSR